jgi:hypothetical protein
MIIFLVSVIQRRDKLDTLLPGFGIEDLVKFSAIRL